MHLWSSIFNGLKYGFVVNDTGCSYHQTSQEISSTTKDYSISICDVLWSLYLLCLFKAD